MTNTDKLSTVSLRVFSKVLDSIEITKILKWDATTHHEIGQPLGGRSKTKKLREETLWIYKLNVSEETLIEEQIKVLVNKIFKKQKYFEQLRDKCNIDIFCSYTTRNGQGGFTLESDQMEKLSSLSIDFIIDFYSI